MCCRGYVGGSIDMGIVVVMVMVLLLLSICELVSVGVLVSVVASPVVTRSFFGCISFDLI